MSAGVPEVAIFAAASETFSKWVGFVLLSNQMWYPLFTIMCHYAGLFDAQCISSEAVKLFIRTTWTYMCVCMWESEG